MTNTPERMTPEAAQSLVRDVLARDEPRYRYAAKRLNEGFESFDRETVRDLLQLAYALAARADALEKDAGRLREFVRRCSYAHLFPVDGLKLSSEAKAALSEPSDDTPAPSEADDHGR